jgi:hypothetical protein
LFPIANKNLPKREYANSLIALSQIQNLVNASHGLAAVADQIVWVCHWPFLGWFLTHDEGADVGPQTA